MRQSLLQAPRLRARLSRAALAVVVLAAMLVAHLCAGLTPAFATLTDLARPIGVAYLAPHGGCDHADPGATPDPAQAPGSHFCAVACCVVAPAPGLVEVSPTPTRGAPTPLGASKPWASLSRAPPSPPPRG